MNKGNMRNRKSTSTTEDDLKTMIKEAVQSAIDEKDVDASDADMPADVLDLIEEAVEAVAEKRKSRKDAGEAVEGDITADEIIAEVMELVEGKTADGREEPTDETEEEKSESGDAGADEDEEGEKRRKSGARRTLARKSASPQRKYSNIFLNFGNEPKQERKSIPPDVRLARAIKCLDVFGRQDPDRAAFHAQKKYGDMDMSREFKALTATSPSSGGFLIPEIYLNEVIEMLYAKTVIFELGARKVPMANGNLNIPKMTTGARAQWGGEQRKIAKTQPAFGNIRLSAKRLEAIVPQTRELLMSTEYSADAIFAQDLTRRMELGIDFGAMYGKGGEFEPLGITNTKDIEVIDASKITNVNLVDASGMITADFPVHVRSKVLSKNVDDLAMGWVFNSMMEGFLMNLKTDTGAYIYREEMNGGKLLGFAYRVSNQIPTEDKKTEMLFGNWADLLIGEQLGLETYTTLDGTWIDEAGVQHSAFEENLTATRALMYVDIAARHAESFAHIKNAVIE